MECLNLQPRCQSCCVETLLFKNQLRSSTSWGNRCELTAASLPITLYQSLLIVFISLFQRFNADYELTARQGADTMAYIALLEEKLRPALVEPPLLWAWPQKLTNFAAFTVTLASHTAAHFLGGCWELCQRDAAVVCLPLAVPAELCGACPTRQHRPLENPADQGRGPATQDLRGGGQGKYRFDPICQLSPQSASLDLHVLLQIYSDAKECLNLLSHRLGSANFFFGNTWVCFLVILF